MFDGIIEHFSDVVEFGFAVYIRRKQAIVDQPKLIGLRIDINTRDNSDAFDDSMSVARILTTDQFDVERIVFIGNRIYAAPQCQDKISVNLRWQLSLV